MRKIINNILEIIYIFAIIFSQIILSGCNRPILELDYYSPDRKGEIKLDKLTFNDKYSFYEENGSLFFIIKLKNNTNKAIEVDKTIQPFGIYYKNKMLQSIVIIPSHGEEFIAPTFLIEPNSTQSFKFELNEQFEFIDGTHEYELVYLNHFMDVEVNGYYDDKYIKTIHFTWSKSPKNNKGDLITSDFAP